MLYKGYYISNDNGHYKIHLGDYIIATADTKAEAIREVDRIQNEKEKTGA